MKPLEVGELELACSFDYRAPVHSMEERHLFLASLGARVDHLCSDDVVLDAVSGGHEDVLASDLGKAVLATESFAGHSDVSRLSVAASCMYAFVSSNWFHATERKLVARLDLLDICDELLTSVSHLETCRWWRLRAMHLRLFAEPDVSGAALDAKVAFLQGLEAELPTFAAELEFPLATSLLRLEIANVVKRLGFLSWYRKLLLAAQTDAGFTFNLDAAWGKRTKFQVDPKLQLIIAVDDEPSVECPQFPDCGPTLKDCSLNDDLLLEQVQLEPGEKVRRKLNQMEQLLMLCECVRIRSAEASDILLDEKTVPFLNAALEDGSPWFVRYSAFYLRSKMESRHSRRVERALAQLQLLVGDTKPKQFALFFSTPVPERSEVCRLLGDVYVSLGLMKSALEVFFSAGMWKDAVLCHVAVGNARMAEDLARELLAEEETPDAWCLVGCATKKAEDFEKAWELSEGRCVEAKRCLGNISFERKEFEESLKHYQDASNVTGIDFGIWFRLAYSALALEKWEEAARAYRHCLNLDYDSFECWNNLARCQSEMGDKEKAWRSISECVRFAYDDSNVWSNFMLLSYQTGRVQDFIRAANRLLDLTGKCANVEMFEAVVDLLLNTDALSDEFTNPKKVLAEMRTLLARLANHCAKEPKYHKLLGD
ncbi:unnamed protein product, partial [Notodromas monacha]